MNLKVFFNLFEQNNRVDRPNLREDVKVWTKISTIFVSAGRNINGSIRSYHKRVPQT